jgi:hypothetical protein
MYMYNKLSAIALHSSSPSIITNQPKMLPQLPLGILSLLSLASAQPTQPTEYTNLPPPTSPGVFTASTRILIHNTTTHLAWAALTNFPAYASWNPFVRSAIVLSPPLNTTVPDQYPAVGLNLLLRTQIPPLPLPVNARTLDNPLATQFAYEEITAVQPDKGRLAWKYATDTLVQAERWQAVSDMGGGDVLYESREVFEGLLSPVVKAGFGRNVQKGFEQQGVGLKMLLEGK